MQHQLFTFVILTSLRAEHPLNAEPAIEVTLSDTVISASLLQFSKADEPIDVTLFGILTPVILYPLNAFESIAVTGRFLYVAGITIFLSVQVPIPITVKYV